MGGEKEADWTGGHLAWSVLDIGWAQRSQIIAICGRSPGPYPGSIRTAGDNCYPPLAPLFFPRPPDPSWRLGRVGCLQPQPRTRILVCGD